MKRLLATAVLVLFGSLTFHTAAQAQSAPPINANLKKAVTLIPIPGIKGALNTLFDNLKQVKPGEYEAKVTVPNVAGIGDIPLQLYFFGDADKQAILLVVNRKIAMPGVFNNRAWKRMAGTTFTDPIFSFSTVDFSLDLSDMSPDLKKIVADSYFNTDSLSFSSGFQLAARAHIGGIMKTVIEVGMGVPVQEFTLRAGAVLPVPMDNNARASLAVSIASDMENVGNTAKDGAEFFVEYQLAPGKTITGPIGMQSFTLSDATISMNNKGTVGYKGNISVQGGKKFITFFETPLNPAGAMDLLDFQFGMTAQSLTLEDLVNIAIAMQTQSVPGGAFIKDIPKYKETLRQVLKPLAVFQLRNPKPVGEYKFGDKNKPFPPLSSFNLLVLGPLASVDDSTGKIIQGPYLKAFGNATILGQQLGSMDVYMGSSGMHAKASERLSLKLGPLGKQTIAMAATVDITIATQSLPGSSAQSVATSALAAAMPVTQTIGLHGSVLGRDLDMSMSALSFSLNSPATCATPFALTADMAIDPNMNVASVLEGLPGVNVDPAQLQNCVGAELEKAYKWIAGTGKNLGGYTAAAANQELTKISNAAAEEAKKQAEAAAALAQQQAEAAAREYERAKNAARNLADNSTSAATNALKDAGNKIKGLFGKKKANDTNDKFDRSIFNWDYYYDTRGTAWGKTDLVQYWADHGYANGDRASLEFDLTYYRKRHPNVSDKDLLNYWLKDGINSCDQGSADFSLRQLLNRYPSVGDNCRAQLDNWFDKGGMDSGLDAKPSEIHIKKPKMDFGPGR